MSTRKNYSREFKLEAVRLLDTSEQPSSELARELGVKRTLLYRWRDEVRAKGEAAFRGSGRPTKDQESEVSRLRRELKRVTEERDILKKAAVGSTDHCNTYNKFSIKMRCSNENQNTHQIYSSRTSRFMGEMAARGVIK